MKKFLLSLCALLAVSFLTGGAAANTEQYKPYLNARFGYSAEYPGIFDTQHESDNGDGIWLESADGEYTLTIWGGHNVSGEDGDALLLECYDRVAYIVEDSERSGAGFYSIAYEGGGGIDGAVYIFHEYGIVNEDMKAGFILKYPQEEEERFTPIKERMEATLTLP